MRRSSPQSRTHARKIVAMTANVAKCLLVSKVLVADGIMSDDEHWFLTMLMDGWAVARGAQ